ncbi:hypothetical protein [Tanticharoenia sakaeratensis]|uniref:Lipoprotein n=1 Tax=Tanticharoenia sakaeratensis NBRC 103193 TaxID=1231623 RepID=A0A0D6MJ36_9PROT|nr:hypothetical protein [Tanticharoenia sakaeratensis]GAN53470.1 hypothetical protein Tasa_010_017 [Tanticharoenia sakaeratensis NBRC 103193]GBQ17775.1 hypothetical protein AA103193_0470 [Tanticharoenia sakaeratensis NBRC 103193]
MRFSLLRAMSFGACATVLSGCGYFDSRLAHKAQYTMVGMTGYDLQACAGIPSSTKTLNDTTQIYQYSGTATAQTSSGSTLLPIQPVLNIWQQAFGGGGTTCTAVIRLDHDRVSEVHYIGDDDEMFGEDGVCSIITRGCARQPESTMRPLTLRGQTKISGFHPPATPQQSPAATYSTQSGATVLNPTPSAQNPIIIQRK